MTHPSSDNEWTVHSINIHGAFFERWCQSVVESTPGLRLDSVNYPVEFPPPNGPVRGKESTLDIRASVDRDGTRFVLLLECKKNNPEFINWVFFEKPRRAGGSRFSSPLLVNKQNTPPAVGWTSQSSIVQVPSDDPVADVARETRGQYGDTKRGAITKTSNAAIQDAANQVALATQAIVSEDLAVSDRLGRSTNATPLPWITKRYLPAIVTSARLFVCDFDPRNIDPRTGEIPLEKAQLSERTDIVYEYALPRHLQFGPAAYATAYGEGLFDTFTRMDILVIQSERLPDFLAAFAAQREDRSTSTADPPLR
jgi:hypothetical protein